MVLARDDVGYAETNRRPAVRGLKSAEETAGGHGDAVDDHAPVVADGSSRPQRAIGSLLHEPST